MQISKLCPETCIIFVTYGREKISKKSFDSLMNAIDSSRNRVRIIISDASDSRTKKNWVKNTVADDVVFTPKGVSAATSRNIATALCLDKYSPKFLCLLEDDFEYSKDWYDSMVNETERLYGAVSPFGLAYGIFTASEYDVSPKYSLRDENNNVTAYFFGAVAYQRFVYTSHYLTVMKSWDPDVLGVSYAQTGGQTFRNAMRGFCGAIVPGNLSWPIDISKETSTWQKGKREPGPSAHSFNMEDYLPILEQIKDIGTYDVER